MRSTSIIFALSIFVGLGWSEGPVASAAARGEEILYSDDAQFTLQVASFVSSDRATALKQTIPDSWIQEIRRNGRIVYRVNYKRFTKRSQALRAQWDLEDLGHQSLVQRLFS